MKNENAPVRRQKRYKILFKTQRTEYICGYSDSLRGAEAMATRHKEWNGRYWEKPLIYREGKPFEYWFPGLGWCLETREEWDDETETSYHRVTVWKFDAEKGDYVQT